MKEPTFLNNINIEVPYSLIYSRLGYRKSTTEISDSQQEKITQAIKKSLSKILIKGCYLKLSVVESNESSVLIESGIKWNSNDIKRYLGDSEEIYLIGATAGKEITVFRDQCMTGDDAFTGVIADAVGSEMVEGGIEWIHKYLDKSLAKFGKKLTTRRYSPGYGDLHLTEQKPLFKILQMNKLGVELSESSIMLPEKSVISIVAIISA